MTKHKNITKIKMTKYKKRKIIDKNEKKIRDGTLK